MAENGGENGESGVAHGAAWSPAWLIIAALVLFVLAVVAGMFAGLVAAVVADAAGWLPGTFDLSMRRLQIMPGEGLGPIVLLLTFSALVTQLVLVAGAILPAARASGVSRGKALGLVRPRGLGAGGYAAFAVALAAYAVGADAVLTAWVGEAALDWPFASIGLAALPYLVVLCVIAPFAEELVFRGWFLVGLRCHWRPWTAIAVSGLLWADLHMFEDPLKAILLFVPGLAYAWLRLRTGSIWPPVIFHVMHNVIVIGITWARASGSFG